MASSTHCNNKVARSSLSFGLSLNHHSPSLQSSIREKVWACNSECQTRRSIFGTSPRSQNCCPGNPLVLQDYGTDLLRQTIEGRDFGLLFESALLRAHSGINFRSLTHSAQQNLVENGGSLDQVLFVVKTTDVEDLKWLDQLVNTSDSYTRFDLPNINVNFGQVWDIFERGIMYVKIDDDVVRISPLHSVMFGPRVLRFVV